MINWCKQNTLFLLITSSVWSSQSFSVADSVTAKNSECHSINSAYQQVHGFETEDYYINICQLDGSFYYYRQSKLNVNERILAPAEALVRGDVFQATADKTTYFVGKDNNHYYSSVMSNDNEILFEPEIPTNTINTTNTSVASQNQAQVNNQMTIPNNSQSKNVNLELNHPKADTEEILVCTREKSTFSSDLDGWQQLVGKSTESASKYAVKQGYNFAYDQENPNLAWIKTQEGITINLSLTSKRDRQIIEQVCLPAEAANKE